MNFIENEGPGGKTGESQGKELGDWEEEGVFIDNEDEPGFFGKARVPCPKSGWQT